MTHPDSDTILRFALQLLDDRERLEVQEHLSGCKQCRDLCERAMGDVTRLQNIDFDVAIPAPPRLARWLRLPSEVWRWAAVLAAGFLLGYITANLSEPLHPIPVQQHLIPESDWRDSSGFVTCQAVDVKAAYEGIR